MANQEHLDILKQGVKVWNEWRKAHPEIRALDFRIVNLSGADLSELNLSGADLSKLILNKADLSMSDLKGVDFRGADLSEANLRGADLSEANLRGADLRGADLRKANLRKADLRKADLRGTVFSSIDYWGTDLQERNLSNADLSKRFFSSTGFSIIDASVLDTDELDFSKRFFSSTGFSIIDASEVDFSGRVSRKREDSKIDLDLIKTRFKMIDLNWGGLRSEVLNEADFTDAFIGWTIFGNVDLRSVKGLESVKHQGPSTIGIDTLVHSQGEIPEVFLRGAGIPDTLIEYARSLVIKPINYYTCFISYSSKDQSFAERLHADLQAKGVRCWFAPEDLKIGDKFRHRIDEAIRLYDKLLVVISHHSVQSAWVEDEVMAALEKENQHNKLVLFPIRLDESVMQTTLPWAASMRRSRHIGDFTRWKDHDAYQQAFSRLLRDLQGEKSTG